jgi:hypothetical protein
MSSDPNRLINGYLDCSLSSDEQIEINDWVKSDPVNARRFTLAVMLHDRIRVQYQSMKLTHEQLDHVRISIVPRKRSYRRLMLVASVACLVLATIVNIRTPVRSNASTEAIAVFHELAVTAKSTADRTYRITFVTDDSKGAPGKGPNTQKIAVAVNNQKMLYVRNGQQFVCTWKAPDGRQFVTGSNQTQSWSIRPGEKAEINAPMHFTGGLPDSDYLAPILNLFDRQDQVVAALYNMELRPPSTSTRLLVAGKKPDTKQGPRRIEIDFVPSSKRLTEMRIWPETPDHRKAEFTRIELVSEQHLDEKWFTPVFHEQLKRPDASTSSAD